MATTSLTAGLVLLLAATIDRFESLKGLGIEAKTKQLDQKIVQADEALLKLREMTELTGTALINFNSKLGRFNSAPSPGAAIEFATHVRQILTKMGSDHILIASALKPWAKTLCFDFAIKQGKQLCELLYDIKRELELERQQIKQPIDPNDSIFQKLSEQIRLIDDFIASRLQSFHRLDLEDYPDKFMDIYNEVPYVNPQKVDELRNYSERFKPGMLALKLNQQLSDIDTKLWIEELSESIKH